MQINPAIFGGQMPVTSGMVAIEAKPDDTLPGWLVNTLLIDIPVSSMEALERVSAQECYQGFSLIYDADGRLVDVRQPDGN